MILSVDVNLDGLFLPLVGSGTARKSHMQHSITLFLRAVLGEDGVAKVPDAKLFNWTKKTFPDIKRGDNIHLWKLVLEEEGTAERTLAPKPIICDELNRYSK